MNAQKYIGTVLWFGTADGGKYGFIQYDDELGKEQSIFFHKNKIAKPSILQLEKFAKGQIVTFSIKQSNKDIERTEAYNILLIDDDSDKLFLLLAFFLLVKTGKQYKIYQSLNKIIENNIDEYLKLKSIIDEEIVKILDDLHKIQKISIFSKYIDGNKELSKKFIEIYAKNISFKGNIILEKINIIINIFSEISNIYNKFIRIIVEKYKSLEYEPFDNLDTLENLLEKFIICGIKENDIFSILKNQNLSFVKHIILKSKIKINTEKIEFFVEKFSDGDFFSKNFSNNNEIQELFQFIEDNKIKSSFLDIFANLYIKNIKKQDENISIFDFGVNARNNIQLIKIFTNYKLENKIYTFIDALLPVDLMYIFDNHDFFNIKDNYQDYIISKFYDRNFLRNLFNKNKINDFFRLLDEKNKQYHKEKLINYLDDDLKIMLWIDDKITFFDYSNYTNNIINTNHKYQQNFIKKLIYLIANKQLNKSAKDIVSISVNDYSTKIVFELIKILINKQQINKNYLKYDLLKIFSGLDFDSVENDILQISDYFNLCHGRTCEYHRPENSPAPNLFGDKKLLGNGNIIDGEQYYYVREATEYINNEEQIPIACDGRWSVKDGKSNLSKGGYCFLWCRNKMCFETTRKAQDIANWKNYTLLDFLKILNIPYNEEKIEILYATINHINRFLSHMNCKGCGKLLKPTGSSNYSFYRVSSFSCDNECCRNPDKDVYLSHCSNGYCDGTIDSRISKRCDNGWVICHECFACCDKSRLDRRNQTRCLNGLPEIAWAIPNGHRGYNILCPNCANPMIFKDIQQKQQKCNDVIRDFERLANLNIPQDQKLIPNYGVNSFNKKWFVVYQRGMDRNEFMSYLEYWMSIGLNIADFDNKTRLHYLVSEPINESSLSRTTHFYCSICNHTYDYTQERDKYWAVKYWHSSDLNPL